MQLSGDTLIPAPIGTVWAGLNDPDLLRACIPGCEALEMTSPTEMTARVTQKIGPVSASFAGQITLTDLNPPRSYRIVGQGSGGVAGFAKGEAHVELAEVEGGTRLSYTVDVAVGGKIAQLGSRLITGVANKLAAQFFQGFSDRLTGNAAGAHAKPPATAARAVKAGSVTGVAGDGPGWRLFALAGWSVAAVLALIAVLQAGCGP